MRDTFPSRFLGFFAHGSLSVVLAAALLGLAHGQPADDVPKALPGEAEAVALIRDLASAPDPTRWFDENQERLSRKVADAADEIAMELIQQNRYDSALLALRVAQSAHSRQGQRDRAAESELKRVEVMFQRAEKPEEYAGVRKSALLLRERASELARMDLVFRSAVLVADSSFFADHASGADSRGQRLQATLEDIAAALPLLRHAKTGVWIERLVSLTAGTVKTATSQYFSEHDKIEAVLKRLVPEIERAIPPDFAYRTSSGDREQKSIATARVLAGISYQYGSPAIASARLSIAGLRAGLIEKTTLEVAVIQDRYLGERRADMAPALLQALRDDAWERSQSLRAGYASRTGRIWSSHVAEELFSIMLKHQLEDESSDPEALFQRIEFLKARMLLDRLTTPGVRELESASARDLERAVLAFNQPKLNEDKLTLEEMRLVSQLSGFQTSGGMDSERSDALRELETLYREAQAGYGEPALPSSLREIQQSLAPDEALIEYIIPRAALHPASDLWALLITRSEIKSTHVPLDEILGIADFTGRIQLGGEAPIDASSVGNLIVTLRTAIRAANEKAARQMLADLHHLLIQPLVELGFRPENFGRLIVVPHGPLHYVPFAALLDDEERFLISKSAVVIAPSASVWRLLTMRTGAGERFVAFANPDLSSRGLAGLPFADQEVAEAVKTMPPGTQRVFRAREATKGLLFTNAPSAGVLHLATHGEFPDHNAADLHAIWLTDGERGSTTLSAAEVRRLKLPDLRLVVLSVCNGGLYRIGPADEPYGLVPAFFEAGAPNVVGTLWKLDDEFGRNFMIEFYRHLAAEGAASALRKASLQFIKEDEYLRNWAAFILVGSGRTGPNAQ
ncbi:MAG: CHAT domain-containing protein [Verrucomicrobiales bacterium]|nr:CHAT domain-containing protein [Verrucomicrobiales bacterium]